MSGVSDCGDLRGANAQSSRGFNYTESSTWNQTGPFELGAEAYLYGNGDTGLYALDTVTLQSAFGSDGDTTLKGQTVAGIASANFWLGSLGLGTSASTFTAKDTSIASFLVSMKEQNLSTSLSYGYTAGQSYGELCILSLFICMLSETQPRLVSLEASSSVATTKHVFL